MDVDGECIDIYGVAGRNARFDEAWAISFSIVLVQIDINKQ
jgi:hypothetical protein